MRARYRGRAGVAVHADSVRDRLKLECASMRVGESGVGRIRHLEEWPGCQSNQLYSMNRSRCIFHKKHNKHARMGVDIHIAAVHYNRTLSGYV